MSSLRHLTAILALPFTVLVVIPACALVARGEPFLRVDPIVALVIGAVGLFPLAFIVWTIALFAVTGRGTLAPWAPPERLVVDGPYRHVRNPMIMGVAGVLAVLALITQSGWIGIELAVFLFANTTYIPIREERGLLQRFGDDYAVYARNVPRWTPRLAAWRGSDDGIPRRDPDDLMLVTVPVARLRGLIGIHIASVVMLIGLLVLLVWSAVGDGLAIQWVLVAGAVTWAMLDLRDAWVDALRDPPPALVFGRMHEDGKTFELREAPGGKPVAGWRFVRREKGAFVLMRKRLASRALVKGLRPTERPFRMAVLYEPRGKPDDDGWIRYPAAAAWEDPPGSWSPIDG